MAARKGLKLQKLFLPERQQFRMSYNVRNLDMSFLVLPLCGTGERALSYLRANVYKVLFREPYRVHFPLTIKYVTMPILKISHK